MERQGRVGKGRSPPRRRGFLAGIAADLAEFAESVGNVVSSAGELLLDNELRRKGANVIVQEASKTLNEAQRGLEAGAGRVQQGARARIGAGAQRLQSVLRNIERQIQEFQRQQQQRDLQSELEHHQKLPVDIQIGDQVYEDMPQEMRSRFWYVLLERPDLVAALTRRGQLPSRPGSAMPLTTAAGAAVEGVGEAAAASSAAAEAHEQPGAAPHFSAEAAAAAVAATIGPDVEASFTQVQPAPGAAASSSSVGASEADATAAEEAVSSGTTPFAAYSSSPETQQPASEAGPLDAAAAAAGAQHDSTAAPGVSHQATDDAPDIDDLLAQQSTGVLVESAVPALAAAGTDADGSGGAAADNSNSSNTCSNGNCAAAGEMETAVTVPSAPSPWLSVHAPSSCNSSSSSLSRPAAPNPWEKLQPAASNASGAAAAAGTGVGDAPGVTSATAVTSPSFGAGETGDGWEMVSGDVPSEALPAPGSSDTDTLQSLVERLSQASLDASRAAQASVFQAMLHEVPWVQGEGMPQDIDPHGEYAQLLASGCGAVEDMIVRDAPRTFPEHPLFTTQEGQQRLLRLLKAYAAADPEVGYCQGMAFPAGVLLMYLPEEHAFRLFRRMMSSGPTLRRLYLPGLDFLKLELSRFELLLSTHAPQLHQHLLDAGLPALLYAAQWLMTCYACPFPIHVAARVLDVLLQADDEAVLLRLGLAVMAALQQGLLELDDFEELITHLKVKPLSWPMHVHRKVLNEALHSPASNAELEAATAAVQAEFARLGRFSSFSSHQLAAQPVQRQEAAADDASEGSSSSSSSSGSGVGRVRLALVPGTMGPRTQASAAALEALEAAAAKSGSSSKACDVEQQPWQQPLQQQQQQQQQQLQQQEQQVSLPQQQQGEAEGSDRSVSGVLCEMDAALLVLMQDMDIVMPTEPAAVHKES